MHVERNEQGRIVAAYAIQQHGQELEWVEGSQLEAFLVPPGPDTLAPTEDDYRLAIQSLIDTQAQSRRYDSGNSLATYVTSTVVAWAAEAVAFVCWRDAVWAYAYAEMDKVLAAEREQPSVEAFIGELPEMVWAIESA